MEDQKIIDLYFARDEEAIQATSEKYGAYCLAVARNILNDQEDAEECVNDTWMRAWDAMPPQRPQSLIPPQQSRHGKSKQADDNEQSPAAPKCKFCRKL